MVITAAIVVLLLGALGYVNARTLSSTRQNFAKLPSDAQWRMKIVFSAVMGFIVVLVFAAAYLLRPHA